MSEEASVDGMVMRHYHECGRLHEIRSVCVHARTGDEEEIGEGATSSVFESRKCWHLQQLSQLCVVWLVVRPQYDFYVLWHRGGLLSIRF